MKDKCSQEGKYLSLNLNENLLKWHKTKKGNSHNESMHWVRVICAICVIDFLSATTPCFKFCVSEESHYNILQPLNCARKHSQLGNCQRAPCLKEHRELRWTIIEILPGNVQQILQRKGCGLNITVLYVYLQVQGSSCLKIYFSGKFISVCTAILHSVKKK